MRIQYIRFVLTVLLAAALSFAGIAGAEQTPVPAQVQDFTPETLSKDGTLRVYLESLKSPTALGVTVSGSYAMEGDPGFQFADKTQITFAAYEGSIYMTVGGLLMDMGTSMTLTRHATKDKKKSGLYIHGTAKDNLYAGDLQLAIKDGALRPVLNIDIEEYLYGVVPYEMSDSFPIEALKAQAVAARTYAMSRKESSKSRDYDVVDTTNDQVFRGYDPNCENSIKAIDETKGLVGLYKGSYATCYFTASNGGQTAMPNHIWGYSGDYGYLDIRDDPYDLKNTASPVARLTTSAEGSKMNESLNSLIKAGLTEAVAAKGLSDELKDIEIERIDSITPVNPAFDDGSRMYKSLRFSLIVRARALETVEEEVPAEDGGTTTQTREVLGDLKTVEEPIEVDLGVYTDLKKTLGLKISVSDCELVSVVRHDREAAEGEAPVADRFDIEMRRFGHGVGMSQRGAQEMGNDGMGCRDILSFYYPYMEIVDMQYEHKEPTLLAGQPTVFGSARPRPTVKPTPKPLPALAGGERYAKVALSSKSSTLNVRGLPSTDAKILDILANGQRVIVVKEIDESWLHVKTAEVEGYVAREFLQFE